MNECLTRNLYNVSKWNYMPICKLLFQGASTIKIQLSVLVLYRHHITCSRHDIAEIFFQLSIYFLLWLKHRKHVLLLRWRHRKHKFSLCLHTVGLKKWQIWQRRLVVSFEHNQLFINGTIYLKKKTFSKTLSNLFI